ncbi:hypothetical protein AYL99_05810 [Fonsecaea erecta]|uniref:Heterokaryon incompatibility domain-containing protein n=1 Tax=Fonsecaea erecta TaxID=1367422 RepID=A0A178ZLX5_9EURO|nr:hypothetical protein AYL99_05810 [Fonsecaea erecta]OAP60808.1 hypothetical protein AYL99_05810 [Fonsecaea erecta]
MPPYSYRPLASAREIRVFTLLDEPFDAPIRGHLKHVSLDANPIYDALSYCWGDDQRTRQIRCNGVDIEVPDSLYVAFRELRRQGKPSNLVIWADALCINQGDEEEKTEQVKMMDQIYQKAQLVHAWLGERSSDSDLAMQFVVDLANKLQSMYPANVSRLNFDDPSRLGLPSKHDAKWYALSRLLRRPWFSRAWIAQELALAPRVMVSCGAYGVEWKVFESLYHMCQEFGLPLHREVPELSGVDTVTNFAVMFNLRQSVQKGSKLAMVSLLRATKNFGATLPRDKVFALLGLARDGWKFHRHVEYRQQYRPVADVFRGVAETMVSNHQVFEMLSQVRHPKRILGLPSWVPDWSFDAGAVMAGIPFYVHPTHAASGIGETFTPQCSGGELVLSGCIVSYVSRLSSVLNPTNSEEEALNTYPRWDKECRDLAGNLHYYPTGETVEEAQWRTRIGNMSHLGKTADASYGQSYRAWCDYLRLALDRRAGRYIDMHQFARLDVESDAFATAQTAQLGGRRFAVTRDGYVGLVPAWSKPTDEVCIFAGASTPHIVRRAGSGYVLVGECYIHGLMNGQALGHRGFTYVTMTLVDQAVIQ